MFVMGTLTIAACLCFAWVTYTTLALPDEATRWNSPGATVPMWHWPILVLACVGAWVLCAGAVEQMLWWMPRSWGGADEDGYFKSTQEQFGSIAGLVGALLLPAHLFRVARERLDSRALTYLNGFVGKACTASADDLRSELQAMRTGAYSKVSKTCPPFEARTAIEQILEVADRRAEELEKAEDAATEKRESQETTRAALDLVAFLGKRLAGLAPSIDIPRPAAERVEQAIRAAGLAPVVDEFSFMRIARDHYGGKTGGLMAAARAPAGVHFTTGNKLACLAFRKTADSAAGYELQMGLATLGSQDGPVTFEPLHTTQFVAPGA